MNHSTRMLCLFASIWQTSAYIADNDGLRSSRRQNQVPKRILTPPFPDGPCGGRVVTIPGDKLYRDDTPFLSSVNPFSSYEDVVLPKRDVDVWLPKEYDMKEFKGENFPILYCHDGQNAMSDTMSWTGKSWRLIGALSRLHEHSMLDIPAPPIVVMIPCGKGVTDFPPSNQRHSEYGDMTEKNSQAHGHFMANVLHPYITSRFRVKNGPSQTYSIGSSLGGQASLQLMLRYPEIFGGAACLSPCFQAGTIAATVANLVQENDGVKSLRSKKIYLDNGGDTDDTKVQMFDIMDHFTMNDNWLNPGFFWLDTQLQPSIDAVRWTLERGNVDFVYKKYPGARHNERGWSLRIHEPLLHLYGKQSPVK